MTLAEEIVALLAKIPGMTDREITSTLRGASKPQQSVNISARKLAAQGILIRRKRHDGLIGNYLAGQPLPESRREPKGRVQQGENHLSEDQAKIILQQWLEAQGWTTRIAWAKERGIDIDADRGADRWIIEVKGIGSRPEMRVNYFIGVLGETLQRMDDPHAKYSIAVPDVPQFRRLWTRLPAVAKKRTRISALFVSEHGVEEDSA